MQKETLALFQKAANEINKRWIPGTYGYIEKNSPVLVVSIKETEDRLDEVWRLAEEDGVFIKEFRETLKRWYLLHIQAIKQNAAINQPKRTFENSEVIK